MYFDTLCRIAEKHLTHLIRPLKKTALFVFDAAPHEFLDKIVPQDELDYLNTQFFLPFPVMSVEDKAGVCMMTDRESNQKGVMTDRSFVDMISFGSNDSFRDSGFLNMQDDMILVSTGIIRMCANTPQTWLANGEVQEVYLFDGDCKPLSIFRMLENWCIVDGQKMPIPNHAKVYLGQQCLVNPKTCLEEIRHINTPSRFVVESAPVKMPKPNSPKIPRSHQRPIYSMLNPGAIHKILGTRTETGTHKSPVPHGRRKHVRKLRSDKFVNKKGLDILIPATWVGPSEAKVGNRIVKVRLDL